MAHALLADSSSALVHTSAFGPGEYDHLTGALTEHADPLTTPERRMLLREKLVIGYRPMAKRIASRYRDRGIPIEDLEQVATVGLINAIDRYEPDRGSPFLAFAVPYARGEVQRHFRDRGWAVRVPRALKERHLLLTGAAGELGQRLGRAPRPSELAEHLDLPIEDVLEGLQASESYTTDSLDHAARDSDPDSPPLAEQLGDEDRNLELVEYEQALRPVIAGLPHRERTILTLRFFGNQTQSQIATQLGLSQMHISRLLNRTLDQLRTALVAA